MTSNDICVSIANIEFPELTKILQSVAMAEIRLDQLNLSHRQVSHVFSSHHRLIATYRIGKSTNSERFKILEQALVSGAAYVDIELENPSDMKETLIGLAKKKGRKVIISFHNFEETPGQNELHKIAKSCFNNGADITKIACLVNLPEDNARILGLYSQFTNLVAIGMGEKGFITRVAATYLGAPFTYAGIEKLETAPGQPDYYELEKIFRFLNSANS